MQTRLEIPFFYRMRYDQGYMNLRDRKKYSEFRLQELGKRIKKLPVLSNLENICIYACGSYARKEAHKGSDIDLFFIDYDIEADHKSYNKNDKALLDAELIKIAKELGFPEFSNDGEYLEVHSLNNILKELGGRKDDYENYFTTRLLMLLESVPLSNETLYGKVVDKTIDAYFRDYDGNEDSFRPIFLLNDIMRFWKTLCLNYEQKRNEMSLVTDEEKAKHRLKNFKLKFSRKAICYSMIIPLSMNEKSFSTKRQVIDLAKLTPLERFESISTKHSTKKLYKELVDRYEWFLDEAQRSDVTEKLLGGEYKNNVFQKGNEFSHCIFKILKDVSGDEAIEKIII